MKLFAQEEVNTGRQLAFDFAKVMSLLFMVLVHAYIYVYGEENMDEGLQYSINNIYGGVLAAPVFMFCMGLGVAYSRHSDPATMLSRGVHLIYAGYVLNFVRCIPQLVLWLTGQGEFHHDMFIEEYLLFDILQFAGVAFFLFALLRKLKASPLVILLVGIALSVFGTYVRAIDLGDPILNVWCYGFVGIHSGPIWSSFPLVNWFIFVAAGYCTAVLVRRCTNMNRFFELVTPVAAVGLLVGLYYLISNDAGMFSEENDDYFYYLTPLDALICICGALTMAGVGHFLMPLCGERVRREIQQLSNDLTRIYLTHWVFVCYLVGGLLVGVFHVTLNDTLMMLLTLAILAVSAWVARHKPVSRIKI